ncbi:hypothetical protein KHM83_19130 [Fusibacter paucivorans]|uniref:Uncharacterized protein n=1 Tax=Fusibacter paucivorans TaxID=76009 RepID=A0ABS5PW02_9FIRM|nr:hypothetical protein [Fusibacter paucivorans]MBS7528784.1 hypothetical protein [Fusibacter paucivorans]
MNKNLIVSIIIGVLIMFSTTLLTGHTYAHSTAIGAHRTAELILRNISIVVGLIVIYSGFKDMFKSK